MIIAPGDLADPRIVDLVRRHYAAARAVTPPGSAHSFDVGGLQAPGIGFWAGWEGDVLMAMGALAPIDPAHGEIKSMHTAEAVRGRGAGGAMLRHLIAEARTRGYSRLSLETGAMDYFAPARRLYARFGFQVCPPFAGYAPDPNSVFMTLAL